jgi:hypothetical protein
MKLADLRKLTIKQHVRIRFVLSNGMECVLTEQGIAQIPALRSAPGFNLEEELEHTAQFQLEVPAADPRKPSRTRNLSREEISAMASAGAPESAHHDEHDE